MISLAKMLGNPNFTTTQNVKEVTNDQGISMRPYQSRLLSRKISSPTGVVSPCVEQSMRSHDCAQKTGGE